MKKCCDEPVHPHDEVITITVSGGVVQDVEGIPEGYVYVLNDLDDLKETE